ncbi:MAG TPA: periplasmic heavy metal sensor [Kofleriaceae bacterium]|nr:periplasmic heavy metal sensor [Kofleriaceae bacterium]
MICLAIGLGVLGFAALRHARRCHRGYHGYGYPYGWGGPWARRQRGRHMLYMGLAHLDASPAQERAIVTEVDRLHERVHAAKRGLRDARGDLAAAVRGPALDDAALGAVLGRVDAATGEARSAVIDALRNIHGVLDDRQRAQVADMLDHGWWRRGGGSPYRV